MKQWSVVLLLVLFLACKEEPKKNAPDALHRYEMPAPIQQLFKQVTKSPDSMGLRLQLVDMLDSIGAYWQAMRQMDSLIQKDSLNYGLWYRKARLQETTKDTVGALRSYKYAIRVYPAPDALLAEANLLAEQKNSKALLLSKQVSNLRMGREYEAHCQFISGIYYARTGDQQKAIAAFNQCIYNDLNYMEAYMEKGFLYYDNKKINQALQIFQTVVTVKNTYSDGYYWLGKCQEALHNNAEAIANYQKAVTLDPKLKEAAEALKRLGVK